MPDNIYDIVITGTGPAGLGVVLDVEGHGIYEHDCDRLLVAHNLVAGCTGAAVMLRKGEAARLSARDGRGSTGRKHRVFHNLLLDCGRLVEFHNPDQRCEHNVYGNNRELGPFRLHGPDEYLNLATWREFYGFDLESVEVQAQVHFDREARTLTVDEQGGMLETWQPLGAGRIAVSRLGAKYLRTAGLTTISFTKLYHDRLPPYYVF